MDRALAVRALALYGPAMLVVLPWAMRSPPARRRAAALLATAWNLPALLLVNVLATQLGWWTFAPARASILGVQVEVFLGWMLLWGAAPVLLLRRLPLVAVIGLLALLDVILMPLTAPVVRLGDSWLVGEAVALAVVLVPAQLLARWTEDQRYVNRRATLQAIVFTGLVLWVLPAIIIERGFASWTPLTEGWNGYGGLHLQLVLVPALLGLSAVQEFATRGLGTPIPFDPPRRLVTSGPYAYVANPMQLAMSLTLAGWGAILHSAWIAVGGAMAVAYSVGLAASDERADLEARFGEPWRRYRRLVRSWLPRWRPYHASEIAGTQAVPALLYVAATCGRCSEVGQWFSARHPHGLEIVPAESHPSGALTRITYDPRDGGREESGVAAVARALEHINLAWAMVGSTVRLPGLRPALQLLVDASGGEARALNQTRALCASAEQELRSRAQAEERTSPVRSV